MKYVENIGTEQYSSDKYEYLCKRILNLDDKIQFSGVLSDKGKILTAYKKDKLQVFLEHKDTEIILQEIALGVRMRREQNSKLGVEHFMLSYGTNMIFMIFPLEQEILCVSAEKDISISEIPFKILKFLNSQSG